MWLHCAFSARLFKRNFVYIDFLSISDGEFTLLFIQRYIECIRLEFDDFCLSDRVNSCNQLQYLEIVRWDAVAVSSRSLNFIFYTFDLIFESCVYFQCDKTMEKKVGNLYSTLLVQFTHQSVYRGFEFLLFSGSHGGYVISPELGNSKSNRGPFLILIFKYSETLFHLSNLKLWRQKKILVWKFLILNPGDYIN